MNFEFGAAIASLAAMRARCGGVSSGIWRSRLRLEERRPKPDRQEPYRRTLQPGNKTRENYAKNLIGKLQIEILRRAIWCS